MGIRKGPELGLTRGRRMIACRIARESGVDSDDGWDHPLTLGILFKSQPHDVILKMDSEVGGH